MYIIYVQHLRFLFSALIARFKKYSRKSITKLFAAQSTKLYLFFAFHE